MRNIITKRISALKLNYSRATDRLDKISDINSDKYISGLSKAERYYGGIQELKRLLKSLPKEDLKSAFAHPEFEGDLDSFEKTAYDYSIEKTSGSPENWLLTIYLDAQEGDIEGAYNYGNLQDLDNDVRMAAKHYQIELNKID